MVLNLVKHEFRGGRSTRTLRVFLLASVLAPGVLSGSDAYREIVEPFPPTETLLAQVAQHQKEIENLFNQYTFTDTTTVYALDGKGQVRGQHTDVFYITPTPYQIFSLHMSHDGKPVSASDLKKQQNEIERKLRRYEQKMEKAGELHPKDTLLFSEIILKSRFTPQGWDTMHGKRVVAYGFEPKSAPQRTGSLEDRIAGDMKGKMWISPQDAEILRVEFSSSSPLSLGMGFLGSVKGFEGYVEQRKVHGEVWFPSHQEFVASGRQLVKGFRIRQVSEYTEFLKSSTDVFQQIHADKVGRKDGTAAQSSSESHE